MLKYIKSRDLEIDLLRFLGLSLIILAHVQPPEVLLELRCFDVPLMLFVSGLAFADKRPDFSISYFIKRFKRLVIPVWLFLSVYFIIVLSLQHFGLNFGVRKEHIIGSYIFMDGIGFVWVIRVFLIIALLTPPLIWLSNKIKSNVIFCVLMMILLCIDELMLVNNIGTDNTFIREFCYYGIGYSLMFMLGLRFRSLSPKILTIVLGLVFLCFTILQLIYLQQNGGGGGSIQINNYKYPPRAIFLLYGIALSIISFFIIKFILKHVKINKIFLFIAQNTIWIYLYHIPLIQLTGLLHIHWLLRYIFVYFIATAIVLVQNVIVYRYKIPCKNYLIG